MISCLIADDQAMVREGFGALLNAQPDMTVAGLAANGKEAVERARETRPDVVLMDIRMPVMDGLRATRELLREETAGHVLVLTTFDLDEYVYEALKAGASGFLLKDAPAAELTRAVRVVAAGEALVAPTVTKRLIADFVNRPRPGSAPPRALERLSELTPREREVLRSMVDGMNRPAIADRLGLSANTVRTHTQNLLAKLDAHSALEAITVAMRAGMRPSNPGDDPPM